MKFFYLFFVLAGGVLVLHACRSHKYSAEALPERVLVFGQGGGFVGVEHRYVLCDNGQLFEQEGVEAPAVEVGHLGRRAARAAFEAIDSLGLRAIDYRVPGNVYAFLEIPSGAGVHRIVWDPNGAVSEELRAVRAFHRRLMEQARAARK